MIDSASDMVTPARSQTLVCQSLAEHGRRHLFTPKIATSPTAQRSRCERRFKSGTAVGINVIGAPSDHRGMKAASRAMLGVAECEEVGLPQWCC